LKSCRFCSLITQKVNQLSDLASWSGSRICQVDTLTKKHSYTGLCSPIAGAFGDEPERLVECAERLGGLALSFGDCSVEVPALPRVPLTIILWRKNEFPATASILYDQTTNKYLPTEDLAVLGELTTARLVQALKTSPRKSL
jgi:hypothetical protein